MLYITVKTIRGGFIMLVMTKYLFIVNEVALAVSETGE